MPDIRTRPSKKKPYQVRYVDCANVSGYGYQSFRTLKEAKLFAAGLELNNTNTSATKRISVCDAVTLWLNICEKIGRDGRETVEPQTLVEYERRGKVIRDYPWQKNINELTPIDVIQFRTWLIENKSRDLARRTLSSFHSIILEMKLQGYLNTDPAAGVSIKTSGRYEDNEVQIPSDQEISDLFSAMDSLASSKHSQQREAWRKFRPMFYLAGFSGMRPSEYRGLPWKDVETRSVSITQRADKTGIIGPVKSKAGKRTIIIPQVVSELLMEWQEFSGRSGEQLVFATRDDKPLLLNNIFYGA